MFHSLPLPHRSPLLSLVLLFSLVVLGAFLGQLVGIQLVALDIESLSNTNSLPSKEALLIFQAVTASGAFIAAPLCYLRFFASDEIEPLFQWNRQRYALPLLLTLGLVSMFIVVNTWFIQWNANVKLPDWLSTFETWARHQELAIKRIGEQLTTFNSPQDLFAGIIVVGLIPAIGEELLFRGLVQPLCHRVTQNIHSAIFISAFTFSAVHLQFYGFVPRLLLGVLFGYIYWWTKDLFFPIVAHFLNNVTALILFFLHQRGIAQQTALFSTKPARVLLILAMLLTVFLAYLLRQESKKHYTS